MGWPGLFLPKHPLHWPVSSNSCLSSRAGTVWRGVTNSMRILKPGAPLLRLVNWETDYTRLTWLVVGASLLATVLFVGLKGFCRCTVCEATHGPVCSADGRLLRTAALRVSHTTAYRCARRNGQAADVNEYFTPWPLPEDDDGPDPAAAGPAAGSPAAGGSAASGSNSTSEDSGSSPRSKRARTGSPEGSQQQASGGSADGPAGHGSQPSSSSSGTSSSESDGQSSSSGSDTESSSSECSSSSEDEKAPLSPARPPLSPSPSASGADPRVAELAARLPGADGARVRPRDATAQNIEESCKDELKLFCCDTLLNKTRNNLSHRAVEEICDSWANNPKVMLA